MSLAARPAAARPASEAGPVAEGLLRLVGGAGAAFDVVADDADPSVERHYRDFLEAIGVAVYTTDAAGRITFFNDAAAAFWGRRPELGEHWCGSWRLFHLDGRPMRHDECPMAVAIRENRAVRGEEAVAERPDGSRVTFVPYPTPLRNGGGDVVGAVNVLVDVTEQRRAEEALRRTAEALRASSAVKDEFLGLVSHELRTPVTTIFGNARLLRDRGVRLSAQDRDSMIADVAGDSERLLRIVENLLLLTRLESGSQVESEPQVLAHVVRMAIESYTSRHTERRISLRREPRHIIVDADRTYLEMVVENLLSNADKYSPPDTTIEVAVRTRAGEANVLVLDRGLGIPEADADQIFVPFYRAPAARQSRNGVGIGLAVCRRVLESQGGRIWARPRAGGGSEFGFALPLAPEPDELVN
ncbi:MAG TPA: ATP-binding protein [Candidatus Caenarcaniphilales bacterium]|nr:ATP-binding protein [Candidatus Caenarcaniphilales bacterium]